MAAELVLKRYASGAVEERPSPTIADALAALSRLDGLTSSELFITDQETAGIYVVGGPDRFVCWVQRWNQDNELAVAEAIDPSAPAGSLKVTLSNGQVDEHALAATVGRAAAIRALETYIAHNTLDISVAWRLDEAWR
jgi:hypothetical protein